MTTLFGALRHNQKIPGTLGQGAFMNTRTMMAGLAVTTLILGSATGALARGHYNNYRGNDCGGNVGNCYYGGYGAGYSNLTPEKQAAVEKLVQQHVDQVEPLRQKLDAKTLELQALSNNANAKPEAITKLAEEIADLRAQMRKAGQDFRGVMENETGIQSGMRGMGNKMGRGMGDGIHHNERGAYRHNN